MTNQGCIQQDHRVFFACECCMEENPEGAIFNREQLAVMPNGTWLCETCYSDCDKSAYGIVASDVDDFVYPCFEDLDSPPVHIAARPAPTREEMLKALDPLMGGTFAEW